MTFFSDRNPTAFGRWLGYSENELWFSKTAEENIDPASFRAEDSLQLSPVVGAVSAIATVAATSDIVVERWSSASEWEAVTENLPAWADPAMRPNPWQTRSEFLWNIAANKLVAGNAIVKIISRRWPKMKGWPSHIVSVPFRYVNVFVDDEEAKPTDWMSMEKIPGYGGIPSTIRYHIDEKQLRPFTSLTAPKGDVLHIRMWTINNVVYGVGPLHLARPPMRTALAADAYAELGFKYGFGPPGILSNRGKVDSADIEAARKHMRDRLRDPRNRMGPFIASGDWDFIQLILQPEQLQLLASRELTFHQVAAIFRVPPALMGAPNANMSGSGIRNLQRYFAQTTCVPFLADIASYLSELLPSGYRVRIIPKHLLDLDPLEQSRVDDRLIRAGILLPSEARRERGLPEIPDLDDRVAEKLWGAEDGGQSDSGKDEGEENQRNTGEGMD